MENNYQIYTAFQSKCLELGYDESLGFYLYLEKCIANQLNKTPGVYAPHLVEDEIVVELPTSMYTKCKDLLASEFGRKLLGYKLTMEQVKMPRDAEKLNKIFIIDFILDQSNTPKAKVNVFLDTEPIRNFINSLTEHPDSFAYYIEYSRTYIHYLDNFLKRLNEAFNLKLRTGQSTATYCYVHNDDAESIRKVIRKIMLTNNIACDYNDPKTMNFLVRNVYDKCIRNASYYLSDLTANSNVADITLGVTYSPDSVNIQEQNEHYYNWLTAEGILARIRQIMLDFTQTVVYPNRFEDVPEIGLFNINQQQVLNKFKDTIFASELVKFTSQLEGKMLAYLLELINVMKYINVTDIDIHNKFNMSHIMNMLNAGKPFEIPLPEKFCELKEFVGTNYEVYFNSLFKRLCENISPAFSAISNYVDLSIDTSKAVIVLNPKPVILAPVRTPDFSRIYETLKQKQILRYNDHFDESYLLTSTYYTILSKVEMDLILGQYEDIFDYLKKNPVITHKHIKTGKAVPGSFIGLVNILFSKPTIAGYIYDKRYDGFDIFKLYDNNRIQINEFMNYDLNHHLVGNYKATSLQEFKKQLDKKNKKLIVKILVDNDGVPMLSYEIVMKSYAVAN